MARVAPYLSFPNPNSIHTAAATLFSQVYSSAVPNRVRGLATNVAGYNAYSAVTPDPITSGNPNYDEQHYINALAPLLINASFPAFFLVDQSRSGAQNIRNAWSDWCNIWVSGCGILIQLIHPLLFSMRPLVHGQAF